VAIADSIDTGLTICVSYIPSEISSPETIVPQYGSATPWLHMPNLGPSPC